MSADDRQRLVLDRDQLRGLVRLLAALGGDQRDRLAVVADDAPRRAPAGRRSRARRSSCPGTSPASMTATTPGRRSAAGGVDRADARGGVRAAQGERPRACPRALEVAAVGERARHLGDAVDPGRALADRCRARRTRVAHAISPAASCDRLEDLLVAGAAAEVAGERLADRSSSGEGSRSSRSTAETSIPGVQKPHCTAPASMKACLDRMQLAAGGERLDRAYLAAVGLERRDEAGADDLAVEPDRAGAALALLAGVLRADQPELVAEHGRAGSSPERPSSSCRLPLTCRARSVRHAALRSSIVQESARRESRSTTCRR